MKKAFFYDTLCGMVYRCMFAGLDDYGHAKWVSITPGEESKTLDDVVIDEDLGSSTRFILICMEEELAQPEVIARVFGKVMECPLDEVGADLLSCIRRMMRFGIRWDKEPLELEFKVFENDGLGKRQGKYTFWVEDKKDVWSILADVDDFNNLNEVFVWIRNFLLVLEVSAEIPVITKDLSISEDLRRQTRKNDLDLFTHLNISN